MGKFDSRDACLLCHHLATNAAVKVLSLPMAILLRSKVLYELGVSM